MGTRGQIKWKAIRKMLDVCAPGWDFHDTKHHRRVFFRGLKAHLPLGKHGHRRNPEIEKGHVRMLANLFDIVKCAKKELEQLR